MSNSWCHVKFVKDGVIANVPTSHFKAVIEKTSLPSHLQVGSIYDVFWAPDPTETPEDIMRSGNEIICVDDIPTNELKKAKANKRQPLKGYFKAALLDLQSREGT